MTETFKVPDGFSPQFCNAVYGFYSGRRDKHIFDELRSRYGTERYYLEYVEEIYAENGWKLDIKSRKAYREIFRGVLNYSSFL